MIIIIIIIIILKVGRQIEGFPTPGRHGDWQCLLHQMVSSYLVHHGFRF